MFEDYLVSLYFQYIKNANRLRYQLLCLIDIYSVYDII